MEELAWKLRISVLWLILGAGMSGACILQMLTSGFINNMIAGEVEGMKITTGFLMVFSLFWIVPLLMAFLTLILKDTANRFTNAILGLVFTLYLIIDIANLLNRGEAFSGFYLLKIFGVLFAFLIFWHAWKWPKKIQG